jgi:hypothetical protein
MGAWGTGPFENDAALDWRARYEEAGVGAIEGAVRAVLRSSGRVDTDRAAEGVAAAATLAELLQAAPTGSARSEAIDRTVRLAPDAIAALDRIVQKSELAELWAETDELEAWASAVRGIQAQLAAVAVR